MVFPKAHTGNSSSLKSLVDAAKLFGIKRLVGIMADVMIVVVSIKLKLIVAVP